MKNIIFLFLALIVSLGAWADDTYTISYCDHKIASYGGYGSDEPGEISAAIRVPAEKLKTLVGNKITTIHVGLVSRINVRNLTVWVRTSLNGENIASGTAERGRLGWNDIRLDTPFSIPEAKDLFLGFTYSNAGVSHTVSFVGTGTEASSFLKTSENGEWQDMQKAGELSLEATVEGDALPQYDLSLNSLEVYPDLMAGTDAYEVDGEVSNLALRDVSAFTLTLSAEDGTKESVTVDSVVASGRTKTFAANFRSSKSMKGNIVATISSLADGADANTDNNSVDTRLSFRRNTVVEEFTTENCPNCPEAAEALHSALESKPVFAKRIIPVSHHSAYGTDWLTMPCDTALVWLYNDGGQTFAPAFMFDRYGGFDSPLVDGQSDNVFFTKSADELRSAFSTMMAEPAHAALGLHLDNVAACGDSTAVTLTVTIMRDSCFQASHPMLTLYLLEDGVAAKEQHGPDGNIDGFVHNNVIRYSNGLWGDPVDFDGDYCYRQYTVGVSNRWKKDSLRIVAFMHNHDTADKLKSDIANGAQLRYYGGSTTAIHTVTPVRNDKIAAVYTIDGRRSGSLSHGINIIRYSDGSVRKVMR